MVVVRADSVALIDRRSHAASGGMWQTIGKICPVYGKSLLASQPFSLVRRSARLYPFELNKRTG